MLNEPVDNYRSTKHNEIINGQDEVIDLRESKPINDPNCEHHFVKDPDDVFDGYTAWTCRKCGRGTYLPDNTKIT